MTNLKLTISISILYTTYTSCNFYFYFHSDWHFWEQMRLDSSVFYVFEKNYTGWYPQQNLNNIYNYSKKFRFHFKICIFILNTFLNFLYSKKAIVPLYDNFNLCAHFFYLLTFLMFKIKKIKRRLIRNNLYI